MTAAKYTTMSDTIPVDWGGRRTSSLVLQPSKQDLEQYANAERHLTCGTCVKFRLRAGQEQMRRERFLERLVLEEGWKVKHLGAPPSTMGLCAETNDTLTSAYSRACEHYRDRKGRIGDP